MNRPSIATRDRRHCGLEDHGTIHFLSLCDRITHITTLFHLHDLQQTFVLRLTSVAPVMDPSTSAVLSVDLNAVINDLILTNDVPTEQQSSEIKGALRSLKDVLRDTNNTIADLQASLQLLEQQRDALGSTISDCQRIFHPMRGLPPCVLLVIFDHYIEDLISSIDQVYIRDTLDPRNVDTPWKLGQVCHRWRRLALQTPTLWTRVGAQLPSSMPSGALQRMRQRLLVQIWRTSGLPITISLETECSAATVIPFLAGIASHSEYIVNLRVVSTADTFGVLHSLSHMVQGHLPSLESFTIDIGEVAGQLAPMLVKPPTITGFSNAPRLREIIIYGDTSDLASIITLPWEQIVRYRSCLEVSPGAVLGTPYGVIENMTRLVEFSDRRMISANAVEMDRTIRPMTLDSLQMLSISTNVSGARTIGELLRHITLPNLRDFRIVAVEELDELYSFLGRHSQSLTSFTLFPLELDLVVRGQMFLRSLGSLPNLCSLTAHYAPQTVVDALAEVDNDSDRPVIVPLLRTLTFRNGITLEDDARFIAMIEARLDHGLRRLALTSDIVSSHLDAATIGYFTNCLSGDEFLFEEVESSLFIEYDT
ncbi:hypothetical protein VNI00_016432 [Paramarasmius palmivorus]|uniref:F-box domain-containing protein n=1 Tax=Paramarasmius palmivorus TaxID=297713 RepID=A0AAW0BDZ1_9AGAR